MNLKDTSTTVINVIHKKIGTKRTMKVINSGSGNLLGFHSYDPSSNPYYEDKVLKQYSSIYGRHNIRHL